MSQKSNLVNVLGKRSEPFGEVIYNGINPNVFQKAW